MQALFVIKFSPFTLKITQITIMFKLFSNLILIWKNQPPNLNTGLIEPPCTNTLMASLSTGGPNLQ